MTLCRYRTQDIIEYAHGRGPLMGRLDLGTAGLSELRAAIWVLEQFYNEVDKLSRGLPDSEMFPSGGLNAPGRFRSRDYGDSHAHAFEDFVLRSASEPKGCNGDGGVIHVGPNIGHKPSNSDTRNFSELFDGVGGISPYDAKRCGGDTGADRAEELSCEPADPVDIGEIVHTPRKTMALELAGDELSRRK